MANSFITQAAPMGQAIDPEMQALQRQKQMAAALMNQMGQQPQGQMVSGHYVPASWTQNLAALVNPMVGSYMATEADKRAIELQNAQDKAAQANIFSAMQTMRGAPARTVQEKATETNLPEGQTLVDDQGVPTLVPRQVAAQAPNKELALAMLLRPNRSALETSMAGKILEQQFKEPKWEKDTRYNERGQEVHGWTDVNDPSLPFRAGTAKPLLSAKDVIDLQWEGKPIPRGAMGGGTGYVNENTLYGNQPTGGVPMRNAPMGNMPTGSGQMGGGQMGGGQPIVAGVDNRYLPKDIPQYQYNSGISPQRNMENKAKFDAEIQTKMKNAQDSFGLISDASQVLSSGAPSSGGLQNLITGTKDWFNVGNKASGADSQLKILGESLTAKVPRFEGPQSDKDTASYRAAAGDVGNPNVPISSRLEAVKTMIKLNKKYYPNGDWDSIDVYGPVTTKQTFLRGEQTIDPAMFREGLTPQDKEAFDWARRNPTDPRAIKIKSRLGIQ